MDIEAARRARRQVIKADLRNAYRDEEASPPEWVDLIGRIAEEKQAIKDRVAAETDQFVREPDVRKALARRERTATALRERIAKLNQRVLRLNLIAPNSRFTRPTLDADEVLRPLFRTARI